MRLRLALIGTVAALLLAAGLASSAPARDAGAGGSKDPAGDVHVAGLGLSTAQKSAVDIVSMRVTGAKGLGVFVTATFRGNFEAAIGKGKLASGAAALVLEPKPGKALSAGLVSVGAGKTGRLHRRTSSKNVGAYRHGKTLQFWILGPGYERVKSVSIETVASVKGIVTADAATDIPAFGPRVWDKFLSLHPIDRHVQVADPSGLSCPELKDLLRSIDEDFGDPGFSTVVSVEVRQALSAFRGTVQKLYDKCAPPPTPVKAVFAWSFFSTNEVAGAGHFTGPATTFSGVKVVLPSGFVITNHLCPNELPSATISGNTISCGGGTLSTGQPFALNLQTSPFPTTGMGGLLFGESGGNELGPFGITGP